MTAKSSDKGYLSVTEDLTTGNLAQSGNKMEDFILKVKGHTCLWDTNSVYFRDFSRKTAAWENVANECRIYSVPQAKALWKRLRDSHREAMRRRKYSQVLAPWKYEELMEFLLPQSSADDQPTIEEASVSEDEEKSIEHETHDSRNNPVFVKIRKRESSYDSSEEKRHIDNERRIVNRRKSVEQDNRNASNEALKDLFSGLCQKTMLLPKHLQLRVQREVFEAVIKAEEEAYENPGCSNCDGNSYVLDSGKNDQNHTHIIIKTEKLDDDVSIID